MGFSRAITPWISVQCYMHVYTSTTHFAYCSDAEQSGDEVAEAMYRRMYFFTCEIHIHVHVYTHITHIPFSQCTQDQRTSQCEWIES